METFRKQLELINLKKEIANTPKKRDQIIEILGKEDGWQELSKAWLEDYDVLCELKNMSISELNYLSNDFMKMRCRLGIWLTMNRLTTIPIGSINPKLAVVIIADNPLDKDYVPEFITQLPYVDRDKNPDEVHVISFSGIPGNWKALAERRGWRVMGPN